MVAAHADLADVSPADTPRPDTDAEGPALNRVGGTEQGGGAGQGGGGGGVEFTDATGEASSDHLGGFGEASGRLWGGFEYQFLPADSLCAPGVTARIARTPGLEGPAWDRMRQKGKGGRRKRGEESGPYIKGGAGVEGWKWWRGGGAEGLDGCGERGGRVWGAPRVAFHT